MRKPYSRNELMQRYYKLMQIHEELMKELMELKRQLEIKGAELLGDANRQEFVDKFMTHLRKSAQLQKDFEKNTKNMEEGLEREKNEFKKYIEKRLKEIKEVLKKKR